MSRIDVDVTVDGESLATWLYLPRSVAPGDAAGVPAVVMAPALALVRQGPLEAYAERFAAAGLAVLLFDFRHLGDSGGSPRQLVHTGRQVADYRAAVAAARARPE